MPALPGPVLSPIGAGDACAGATLHAWLRSSAADDGDLPHSVAAFCFGVACGAASCLTDSNSEFDLAQARSLRRAATVTRLQ